MATWWAEKRTCSKNDRKTLGKNWGTLKQREINRNTQSYIEEILTRPQDTKQKRALWVNQSLKVCSWNSCPECHSGTSVTDVAIWCRCGRSETRTGVQPLQKTRSHHPWWEEPGKLPEYTKRASKLNRSSQGWLTPNLSLQMFSSNNSQTFIYSVYLCNQFSTVTKKWWQFILIFNVIYKSPQTLF